MTTVAAFRCDGPDCTKESEPPEAVGWMQVNTMVLDTTPVGVTPLRYGHFCSAECLEDWASDLIDASPPVAPPTDAEVLEAPPGVFRLVTGQYL